MTNNIEQIEELVKEYGKECYDEGYSSSPAYTFKSHRLLWEIMDKFGSILSVNASLKDKLLLAGLYEDEIQESENL